MASGWYNTGVVAVVNGSAAIVGTGTAWVDNGIEAGMGFLTADGRVYAISAVNSNTSVTLDRVYGGSSGSGLSYDILPLRGNIKLLTDRVNLMLDQINAFSTTYGVGKAGDGTVAAPAYSFLSDQDTGMTRYAANTLAFSTNGIARLIVNNTGVGIGAIPYAPLEVVGTGTIFSAGVGSGIGNHGLEIKGLLDAYPAAQVRSYFGVSNSALGAAGDLIIAPRTSVACAIRFITGTAPAERMRVDGIGNVAIGTPSTSAKLAVVGSSGEGFEFHPGSGATNLLMNYNRVAGAYCPLIIRASDYRFMIADSQKMTLDASGNLLVGKTGNSNVGEGAVIGPVAASFTRTDNPPVTLRRDGTDGPMVNILKAGTLVGSISVTAASTGFNTSSDRRLKENIELAQPAGEIIDSLEIVQYDWKVGGSVAYGVIAQDAVEVFPGAISIGDDNEESEEIEQPWGVDYSKYVPLILKEMQDLRARVAELESQLAAQ